MGWGPLFSEQEQQGPWSETHLLTETAEGPRIDPQPGPARPLLWGAPSPSLRLEEARKQWSLGP